MEAQMSLPVFRVRYVWRGDVGTTESVTLIRRTDEIFLLPRSDVESIELFLSDNCAPFVFYRGRGMSVVCQAEVKMDWK